jgi:hypothetical protein
MHASAMPSKAPRERVASSRGLVACEKGELFLGRTCDVAHAPKGNKALQFQPVEILGGGHFTGEIVKFFAFDLVVFKGLWVATGQQRCFGLEVLVRKRLEMVEGLVKRLGTGLATVTVTVTVTVTAKAAIGEHIALGQQRLVLGVDEPVADTEIGLPSHAVGHGLSSF